MWTRAEIVDHYCARMGFAMTPEQWRFYEVFGLFRLAVIAQQIWYRYALRPDHQRGLRRVRSGRGPPGVPLPSPWSRR